MFRQFFFFLKFNKIYNISRIVHDLIRLAQHPTLIENSSNLQQCLNIDISLEKMFNVQQIFKICLAFNKYTQDILNNNKFSILGQHFPISSKLDIFTLLEYSTNFQNFFDSNKCLFICWTFWCILMNNDASIMPSLQGQGEYTILNLKNCWE